MNKENKYSNLEKWCERYHEDNGIKIHPSSVPVELVLEDVLGYIAILISNDNRTANAFDAFNGRLKDLELLIHELTAELTKKVLSEEIKPTQKKVKKNDKSND